MSIVCRRHCKQSSKIVSILSCITTPPQVVGLAVNILKGKMHLPTDTERVHLAYLQILILFLVSRQLKGVQYKRTDMLSGKYYV